MSGKITISVLALCFFASMNTPARTIDAHSGPDRLSSTINKQKGKKHQPTISQEIQSEPCNITSIELKIPFGSNPVVCPGKRVIPEIGDSEVKVVSTGVCSLGVNPTVLELSDATGSFSNPVILLEAPFIKVATALARRTEVPGEPTYIFPRDTPPGANYLLRFRVKDYNVTGKVLGPFTVLPPDNASISNLIVDASACPVQIRVQAISNNMMLTGSDGYIYSYVSREERPATVSFPVTKEGNYTLINSSSQSTCLARQNVTVSRSCQ